MLTQRVLGSALWLLTIVTAAAHASCPGEASLAEAFPPGWGITAEGTRHVAADHTSINRSNVGNLSLKWVYRLNTSQPRSYPLVTEDTIFVGDGAAAVALDRETGCERWRWGDAYGELGSGVLLHDDLLIFNIRPGFLIGLDARTGAERWRAQPGDNPARMLSGTPALVDGRVLVPISSLEIGYPANFLYGCCATSGGLVSVDVTTGKDQWVYNTIENPGSVVTGTRWRGLIDQRGPSGAPVWGSVSVDDARGSAYVGTGQNYSHPTSGTSDAIISLNYRTGEPNWIRQFTENDAYNIGCDLGGPNCPDPQGPDADFGAVPILVDSTEHGQLVIAGQKSSEVHAMRPDDGAVVWQTRVGRGGALGGVHWGIAANNDLGMVYVPNSDRFAGRLTGPGEARPGLFALDIDTGEIRWYYRPAPVCDDCWPGLSSAIVATDEVVFVGTLDGVLSGIDAASGEPLWSFQTGRQLFDAVNGGSAEGGSFDAHGPLIVDDLLLVSSGYGSFFQDGGNAFMVFQLDDDANGEPNE